MLPPVSPEAIKALREKHQLHQTQVAALLYVSRRTVQYWEEGGREMPMGLWELLNIRLGECEPVPLAEFLAPPEAPQGDRKKPSTP